MVIRLWASTYGGREREWEREREREGERSKRGRKGGRERERKRERETDRQIDRKHENKISRNMQTSVDLQLLAHKKTSTLYVCGSCQIVDHEQC